MSNDGIWAFALNLENLFTNWNCGFHLNIEFVIAVLTAATLLVLVFGLCSWTTMSLTAAGALASA